MKHERTSSEYKILLPGPIDYNVFDELERVEGIDPHTIDFGFGDNLYYRVFEPHDTPQFHAEVKEILGRFLE